MALHSSRKTCMSEIYAQLVGRALGILYWVICTTYLVKESVAVTDYYLGYLLSQDVDTAEKTQVVETVFSCLLVIVIAIFLALERIVLMCKVFEEERSFLKPYVCINCQRMKYQKKNLNQVFHVKESPSVKTVFYAMNVKAVFLRLKTSTNQNKNKNKTDTTKKG